MSFCSAPSKTITDNALFLIVLKIYFTDYRQFYYWQKQNLNSKITAL